MEDLRLQVLSCTLTKLAANSLKLQIQNKQANIIKTIKKMLKTQFLSLATQFFIRNYAPILINENCLDSYCFHIKHSNLTNFNKLLISQRPNMADTHFQCFDKKSGKTDGLWAGVTNEKTELRNEAL